MTFLHSCGVYGTIVKSVTGPGRFLDGLIGVGGGLNVGGAEGGTAEKRLATVSKLGLRTRGMRRAILNFGLFLFNLHNRVVSVCTQYVANVGNGSAASRPKLKFLEKVGDSVP